MRYRAEASWNQKSIENSGWKDEWFTILLSLPVIGAFGPKALQDQILNGFRVIAEMPVWFQTAFAVAVSAAFGYRKYADWRMTKAYSLPEQPNDTSGKGGD